MTYSSLKDKSMSRKTIILAIVTISLLGLGLFNKYLAAPPSETTIRRLLSDNPMPQVTNQTGDVLPSPDSSIRFTGIYPLSWGTVALYHTDHMQGDALLGRGFLGWDFRGHSWGPIAAFKQHKIIAYEHTHAYDAYVLKSAEVVWGTSQETGAARVAVAFDDGTILEQPIDNGWFAVVSDGHGGACTLTVFRVDDTIAESIPLEPRDPPGLDASAYDCKR
jgi:hypothetical protein